MASALKMIDKIGDHGGSILGKGAIGYGTARLLARHCHGKKDSGRVPLGIAIGGKLIPALAALFLGDVDGVGGMVLGGMDAAGQGAVDFLGVVHGLRDARQAKGIKVIGIPVTADVKALPAGAIQDAELLGQGQMATLGGLGIAQPGSTLSPDQIRELQSYR